MSRTTGATAIPRYRRQTGPAILDQGFRPFFLLAGIYGGGVLSVWVALLHGADIAVPSLFFGEAWHAHEMLYGFAMAVLSGFLLTAIPNWTGRLPLQGMPLLGLVSLWIVGRLAVSLSAVIGAEAAMILDLAFPTVLLVTVTREIAAGRNWRNLPMVGGLGLFTLGNLAMHLEGMGIELVYEGGARLGLAVLIMMISLVGGRIVPSFTRNWLVKQGETKLPASFGYVDKLALAVTLAALALYVVDPELILTAGVAIAAAGLHLLRLSRWKGLATVGEPLLFVLHVAYLWIPIGFAMVALTVLLPEFVPHSAAPHAFGTGAVGAMTLAVMTRATLGHTGRALHAGPATMVLYLSVMAAGILRLAASLLPSDAMILYAASGTAWVVAFLGFAIVYGPYLLRRRTKAA